MKNRRFRRLRHWRHFGDTNVPVGRGGKKHHVGYYKTKRERDKARVAWLLKYERGQVVSSATSRTVAHAIDRYRAECLPSYGDKSRGGGQLTWWEQRVGHKPIDKLNRADIAEAIRPLKSEYLHNRHLSTISAVCREAIGWCWINENPVHGVRRRSESTKGAGRPFSKEELDRVLQSAREDENRYFCALPVFLADTGCRLGEALGLQWAEVDLAQGTVTFLDTKNKRDHLMPLTDRVLAGLHEVGRIRILGDDRVFRLVNPYNVAAVPRARWSALQAHS